MVEEHRWGVRVVVMRGMGVVVGVGVEEGARGGGLDSRQGGGQGTYTRGRGREGRGGGGRSGSGGRDGAGGRTAGFLRRGGSRRGRGAAGDGLGAVVVIRAERGCDGGCGCEGGRR